MRDIVEGAVWRDKESGIRYVIHGITGNGISVSAKPDIAEAQRTGPPMVLLSREDMEPHIFDWMGESVLIRDFEFVGSTGKSRAAVDWQVTHRHRS